MKLPYSLIQPVHSAIVIFWTIFASIFFGSATIVAALITGNDKTAHRIASIWGRAILLVSRVQVSITGLSHIDPSRAYILMANHQSVFDIPILLGCLPLQFRWLAKAELFKIPIFGQGMRSCGYISIDRGNQASSFESIAHAARTLSQGKSILIFPEGTRTRDGKLRPFKKGGFVLAVDAGAPIVPIIIRGAFSLLPKGRLHVNAPAHIQMRILAPIATTSYSRDTKESLMERVRERMLA